MDLAEIIQGAKIHPHKAGSQVVRQQVAQGLQ